MNISSILVGGFNPSEKNMKVRGGFPSQYIRKVLPSIHVPNKQHLDS